MATARETERSVFGCVAEVTVAGILFILQVRKFLKAVHMLLTPCPDRSASGLRVETPQTCDKQKSEFYFQFLLKITLTENCTKCYPAQILA
jgi:hypothetical protein